MVSAMTKLEAAEQLLASMTRGEKALLLQWVVRDLGDAFPGIESQAAVCGGEPCIVRTRIPVWVLARARQLGVGEAELLQSYPALRAEDLGERLGVRAPHQDEIERQIAENETA